MTLGEKTVLHELTLRPNGAPFRSVDLKEAVLSLASRQLVCDPHTIGTGTIGHARKAGSPFVVIAVPWDMLAPHEAQAQRNHSQTLTRLAERGGLSACEALAVFEDREWRRMGMSVSNAELAHQVSKWLAVNNPVTA